MVPPPGSKTDHVTGRFAANGCDCPNASDALSGVTVSVDGLVAKSPGSGGVMSPSPPPMLMSIVAAVLDAPQPAATTHHKQPPSTRNEDRDTMVLQRKGVEGIDDPWIFELDIDYNLPHDSNPECEYGGKTGREKYEKKWWYKGKAWEPGAEGAGNAELGWRPSGC